MSFSNILTPPNCDQVSARDDDLGVNSQLRYFIDRDWEGLFSLSPNGTFHMLQSLDREVTSLYKLDIMAVDSGDQDLCFRMTKTCCSFKKYQNSVFSALQV